MKKRWLILPLSFLTLAGFLMILCRDAEPTYQGHRLHYWVQRIGTQEDAEATTAVRAMGAPAIPFLILDLRAQDSAWQRFYRTNWLRIPTSIRGSLPVPQPPELKRLRALWALRKNGPKAEPAVPALIELEKQTFPSVLLSKRQSVTTPTTFQDGIFHAELIGALCSIGGTNKALIPLLLRTLGNSNPMWPNSVEFRMQNHNLAPAARQSVDLLRASLTDTNPEVRIFSIQLLASLVPERPELSHDLIDRLGDWSPQVCDMAERALVSAGSNSPPLIAALTQSLEINASLFRTRVAGILADIGPPARSALPVLHEVVKTEDPFLKRQAARGLWRINREYGPILPFWIEDLRKPSDVARWDTLTLIAGVGPRAVSAVPAVARVLHEDESNRVRAKAAMTLSVIGAKEPQTRTALTSALKDDFANVREAAQKALDDGLTLPSKPADNSKHH